ncbi:hypothetical protein DWU98_20845 [Dyella monticola]|uniref:Uncharacterized protein n=2 Tax=Dyella monticola TaxID=1927958 RepID=A0A370WRM1_9GAMM|nr:hypothetical protein DWU98_20845 [Dyella monticola]
MKTVLKAASFAALTLLSSAGNAGESNKPQKAMTIVVSAASSEQQVYRCDVCTSMAQLDSWFRIAMNGSAYTGEWWAVNFQNGLVKHYQVDRPGGSLSITVLDVDQNTQNYVNAVRNMSYINFGNTLIVLNAYYDASDKIVLGPWDGN